MSWFLPRFEAVLRDPESAWGDWQAEYTKVCGVIRRDNGCSMRAGGLRAWDGVRVHIMMHIVMLAFHHFRAEGP